jgi:RHS repeat-associated protein
VHAKRLTEPYKSVCRPSVFNDFSIFTSPNSTTILNPAKQNTDTRIRQTNYYPFGLTHQGYNNLTTSLGSAGAKKYQYNGKELQEDFRLDWYDYGARFYDAGLGRFHTLDPLAEKYSLQSPYAYAVNNPFRFVDFMGMEPGDFYDQNGNKVGTDGRHDKKVYIVTNQEEVNQISKTNSSGGTTQATEVKSKILLPSASVRLKMCQSVDRSNSPNNSVGDTKGGFHEEGGTYGKADGKDMVVNAKPGLAPPNMQLKIGEKLNINPLIPADSKSVPKNYVVTGTFHVHPSGYSNGKAFVQKVSKGDINFVKNPAAGKGYQFVLGARSKEVYIYTSKGTVATFPLSSFKNIGN